MIVAGYFATAARLWMAALSLAVFAIAGVLAYWTIDDSDTADEVATGIVLVVIVSALGALAGAGALT